MNRIKCNGEREKSEGQSVVRYGQDGSSYLLASFLVDAQLHFAVGPLSQFPYQIEPNGRNKIADCKS